MKRCPACDAPLEELSFSCERCEWENPIAPVRKENDEKYLSQDTWKSDNVASFQTLSGPVSSPVAMGFPSAAPEDFKFNSTISVSRPNRESEATDKATAAIRPPQDMCSTGEKPHSAPFDVEDASNEVCSNSPFSCDTQAMISTQQKLSSPSLDISKRLRTRGDCFHSTAMMGVGAVILLLSWIVPDSLGERVIWPLSRVDLLEGLKVFALVSVPACGAILLSLVIAPIGKRLRGNVGTFVSLFALVVPCVLDGLALSVRGEVALVAAILSVLAALIAVRWLKMDIVAYIVLSMVPIVLIGVAFYGVTKGTLDWRMLRIFRDPILILGAMIGLTAALVLSTERLTYDLVGSKSDEFEGTRHPD